MIAEMRFSGRLGLLIDSWLFFGRHNWTKMERISKVLKIKKVFIMSKVSFENDGLTQKLNGKNERTNDYPAYTLAPTIKLNALDENFYSQAWLWGMSSRHIMKDKRLCCV